MTKRNWEEKRIIQKKTRNSIEQNKTPQQQTGTERKQRRTPQKQNGNQIEEEEQKKAGELYTPSKNKCYKHMCLIVPLGSFDSLFDTYNF